MAAFVAEKGMKDPIFADCLRSSRPLPVHEYNKASSERHVYSEMWNKNVCVLERQSHDQFDKIPSLLGMGRSRI